MRAAIQETNALLGADEITLPTGLYELSIPGTGEFASATGDLNITDDLTLTGAGASSTIIDAGGLDRAILIFGFSVATEISGFTVQNGRSTGGGGILNIQANTAIGEATIRGNLANGPGGGVENVDGQLYLSENAVVANVADTGGGIWNDGGALTLINTTVSGNTAVGGSALANTGLVSSTNSTIAWNVTTAPPGIFSSAILNFVSELPVVTNTILAHNSPSSCLGSGVASGGHNIADEMSCVGLTAPGDLTGVDPLLDLLADNGGGTPTHALLPGSPAIDAASLAVCPAVDQRGLPRPQGAGCDIGSFEAEAVTVEDLSDLMSSLPLSTFRAPGVKVAALQMLGHAAAAAEEGNGDKAIAMLETLRLRLDGCGTVAARDDWIVDCSAQVSARTLVDAIIASLQ